MLVNMTRIADYLIEHKFRHFYMNIVHRRDYEAFKLSLEDFMKRYLIGHYNPAGNHLVAYSLKDTMVQWLDPKPVTYCGDAMPVIDFKGYLPEWEQA